jgi:hypothetical protein
MNHALATPADRRRHLAEHPEQYACRLVEFLLGAVTAAAAGTGDLQTGTVQE